MHGKFEIIPSCPMYFGKTSYGAISCGLWLHISQACPLYRQAERGRLSRYTASRRASMEDDAVMYVHQVSLA